MGVRIIVSENLSMEKKSEPVTIWTTDYQRAIILKGRLESEGIPVLLSYEAMGPGTFGGILVDGWAEVKIRVPAPYARRARKILEEIGLK